MYRLRYIPVSILTTDLHIYNLDAVRAIHVVWKHIGTDKLTTANGGTFTSSSARVSSQSRQSPIERAVTWLATESSWTRGKRSAICSGQLCGGFIIFVQCCPCGINTPRRQWLFWLHDSNIPLCIINVWQCHDVWAYLATHKCIQRQWMDQHASIWNAPSFRNTQLPHTRGHRL